MNAAVMQEGKRRHLHRVEVYNQEKCSYREQRKEKWMLEGEARYIAELEKIEANGLKPEDTTITASDEQEFLNMYRFAKKIGMI
jgi:hypothetical protein